MVERSHQTPRCAGGRYGHAFDEHHFLERWAPRPAARRRVGPQLAPTDPVTVNDGEGARVAR